MDKISVIIPTYNREGTIRRSIESVLNQSYTNLQVLVIDDGSTDGTGEVVKQIGDSRVQYVLLEENGGVANARNSGAQLAEGEWIAFQDSDDCWRPDKLEKQMAYAREYPEYSMIYGSYLAHFESGEEILRPEQPLPAVMEGEMMNTLLLRNVIGAPTILVKKECFLASGGFDKTYKSLEDWEYAIRFAGNYKIGFMPDILMDVYVLRGGISSGVGAYFDSRCRMLAEYRREILQAGLFDNVVKDIIMRAGKAGLGEQVEHMMMLYLQTIPPKR